MEFILTTVVCCLFMAGSLTSIVYILKNVISELTNGIHRDDYVQNPWKDMCPAEKISWIMKSIPVFAAASVVPVAITIVSVITLVRKEYL